MRIIIPVLGFGRAGGNRVLSEFANEWVKQGCKVDFLCPDSSDEVYFPTSARVLWVDGFGRISEQRNIVAKPQAGITLNHCIAG